MMAYVEIIVNQKLVMKELDISQFPKKLTGRVAYQTPVLHTVFDRMNMDLSKSDLYLHPEHSFIGNIRTDEGGTIELIIHSDCLKKPHGVHVPQFILQDRAKLSWINWNMYDDLRKVIRETQDSGDRGIVEVFGWDMFVRGIVGNLIANCENKEGSEFWRMLENGQVVAVDHDHNCLIDLKHKENEHLANANSYYERLDDWDYIAAQ